MQRVLRSTGFGGRAIGDTYRITPVLAKWFVSQGAVRSAERIERSSVPGRTRKSRPNSSGGSSFANTDASSPESSAGSPFDSVFLHTNRARRVRHQSSPHSGAVRAPQPSSPAPSQDSSTINRGSNSSHTLVQFTRRLADSSGESSMTDDLPPPAEALLRDHSCDDDGAARSSSSTRASTAVQSTRRSESAGEPSLMDLPPSAENLLRDDSCDVDGAARRSSSTVVQSTRRSESTESSATDLPDLPTEASCADEDDGERVTRISSIDSKPPFSFEHTHRSVSARVDHVRAPRPSR
jgi:hypothetical protein